MSATRALKVAFYAPLKSPRHPQPSGDRLIAQLLFKALQKAGFEVRLVSEFRSRDAQGDTLRQTRMLQLGEKLAERLLQRWQREGYQPDVWFCYHNYYKAPDLLGPPIAAHLRIPYWVAEASWADKRAEGRWKLYHQALRRGLQMARGVLVLNPRDAASLERVMNTKARRIHLPAFLDLTDLPTPKPQPVMAKAVADSPAKLVAVAMLRPGDKLHSMVLLARALRRLSAPFQLLIIGDGAARLRIQSVFAGLPVCFAGQLQGGPLYSAVGRCDLLVWPAVNEAIGMALLEAQACGVPVLAGREGGTDSVVAIGHTGELVKPRDPEAFAAALQSLLDDPERLLRYRSNTRKYVEQSHTLDVAARSLKAALSP